MMKDRDGHSEKQKEQDREINGNVYLLNVY